MKLKLQTCAAVAIVAFMLVPASARADAVGDWNKIAVQAVLTAGAQRPGPTGLLDLAMAQAAVYDAVQAIEGEFEPYHVHIPGASGSPAAATAKAAHDVLVNRFPAQTASLDAIYLQYLAANNLDPNDPGVAVGAIAAAGIIAFRANDGSFPNPPPPPFVGGTAPGQWRPTFPAFAPMLVPWLGNVTPFTLTSPSQFLAQPPPGLNTGQYTQDYNEVKALGALNNSARSPAQTDLANFWNANFAVMWNQVVRDFSAAQVDNIGENARLFALVDMAMADAIITAWNSKNAFVLWRPITAIQLGDTDGNKHTVADASWLPLIVTPPYPDQTSGANNISSAALHSLRLFFGKDKMTFSVTTTNTGPTNMDTRTFSRFSDARQEVVDARIYQGIHFRFADEDARKQGGQVARWAFNNFLRPVHDDGDDGDGNDND